MASQGIFIGSLPELVRDSQLPAQFESDGQSHFTIHVRSSSRRSTQEKWLSKRMLGMGGQGSVDLQIQHVVAGAQPQLRAVKTIYIPDGLTPSSQKLFQRELETIAKFSQVKYSDHFVKSFGWYLSPGRIHIAMELCEQGDLEKYLSKCRDNRLPEAEAHDISSQILDALHSMHCERFCHRDLKLANVLIMNNSPTWWVKLADFGLSKRDGGMTQASAVRGTINYMPPELFGYTANKGLADPYPVDMWCLGQAVFRLIAGQFMFASIADLSKYYCGQLAFPDDQLKKKDINQSLVTFIKSLVAPEPTKRISSKDAMSHSWITTIQKYTVSSNFKRDSDPGLASMKEGFSEASAASPDEVTTTLDSQASVAHHRAFSESSAVWPDEETTVLGSEGSVTPPRASATWTEPDIPPHPNREPTQQEDPSLVWPTETYDAPTTPPTAEHYKKAGSEFYGQKNFAKAIQQYTLALRLSPLSAVYLGDRAISYMACANYEAAMRDCSRIIENVPYNSRARRTMARIYLYGGLPGPARDAIRGILPAPSPQDISDEMVMINLVEDVLKTFKSSSGFESILDRLDRLGHFLPSAIPVPRAWQLWRVEVHLKLRSEKDIDQAKSIMAPFLAVGRPDSQLLFLNGRVQYYQDDLHNAVQSFNQCVSFGQMSPQTPQARSWSRRAIGLISRGDEADSLQGADAIRAYTAALKVEPCAKKTNARFLVGRARSHIEMKNYPSAISDCQRAITFAPSHVEARLFMGTAASRNGDYQLAISVWEEALHLDPDVPELKDIKYMIHDAKMARAAAIRSTSAKPSPGFDSGLEDEGLEREISKLHVSENTPRHDRVGTSDTSLLALRGREILRQAGEIAARRERETEARRNA